MLHFRSRPMFQKTLALVTVLGVLGGCTKRDPPIVSTDVPISRGNHYDEDCRPDAAKVHIDAVPGIGWVLLGRCTTSAAAPLAVTIMPPCVDAGSCSGHSITLNASSRIDLVSVFDAKGPGVVFDLDPWIRPPSRMVLANPQDDLSPPVRPLLLLRTVGNQDGDSPERLIAISLADSTPEIVFDVPLEQRSSQGTRFDARKARFEPGTHAAMVITDVQSPREADAATERRISLLSPKSAEPTPRPK